MASFCISGQPQEYLGFAEYLIYQTLNPTIKLTTDTVVSIIENCKDYGIVGFHNRTIPDQDALDNTDAGRRQTPWAEFDISILQMESTLQSAVNARITKVNASYSDMTVDKIIYRLVKVADYSSQVYGCAWLKTETDSVVTTSYDKVMNPQAIK